MRRSAQVVVALALAWAAGVPTRAQDYPTAPVPSSAASRRALPLTGSPGLRLRAFRWLRVRILLHKEDLAADLVGSYEITDLRELAQELRVACQPFPCVAVVHAEGEKPLCTRLLQDAVLPSVIAARAGEERIIIGMDRNFHQSVLQPVFIKAKTVIGRGEPFKVEKGQIVVGQFRVSAIAAVGSL